MECIQDNRYCCQACNDNKNVGALTHEEMSVHAETNIEMDMPEPITDAADDFHVYDISTSHLDTPRSEP